MRVAAAGLNYIDTYHRSGLYPMTTPFVPGVEAAGTVEAVGEDVTRFAPGDRVASVDFLGAYAELAAVPEARAVRVPDEIELETAAAVLLQGVTAHYLTTDTYPLGPEDRVLVHAAAGGTGRLLVQMAKRRGAEVVATAGGPEKVDIARGAGADHVIDYRAEDFKDAVEAVFGTKALAVVYDGVGAETFDRGLELLRPRGLMVAFGNASGPPPPLDVLRLMRLGSLYVTRPTMGNYVGAIEELERRAADSSPGSEPASSTSTSAPGIPWPTRPRRTGRSRTGARPARRCSSPDQPLTAHAGRATDPQASFSSGAQDSSNRFSPTLGNRTIASALSPSPEMSMITPSPHLPWRTSSPTLSPMAPAPLDRRPRAASRPGPRRPGWPVRRSRRGCA